ncbi:hypothetical protein P8C59_001344 [Phyllachora maydis]|uniref:Chitin-binding type-4 domain-containing protein n=1 Tax=Phyllachora maydis TaxID=1825666 RepID=A0AAD9M8Z1_9PEZI|nr:hypothetical protein P8C59_001344 [Phyllachora maydis]
MHLSLLSLSGMFAVVLAHGNVTQPPARVPGPAMAKACGQDAVKAVLEDGTTPLEDVFDEGVAPPATCKLNVCRGALYEDNKDRLQTWTPGQVVNVRAILPVLHEGPMNMSIISSATNKVIGAPLISFKVYASDKVDTVPANNTNFNITIPATLGKDGTCTKPGDCFVQWFWFGTSAKQTYESCIDFVVGAGAANASTSAAPGKPSAPASTRRRRYTPSRLFDRASK